MALKQINKKRIHVCFYENFVTQPQKEVDKLFQYLGKNYTQNVFKKMKIPSAEVREKSAILTGDNIIEKWKKEVTSNQIQQAIDILSIFELDKIYSEEPEPIK